MLPLLDGDDEDHAPVREAVDRLLDAEEPLLTSNYVLVETAALLQARMGLRPLRALGERILPLVEIAWVERGLHDAAWSALLAAGRRGISLVDRVSFELMRRRGVDRALALDDDFVDEGFALLP